MFDNLEEKVLRFKERRNAIILAHHYQLPEIHNIADFTGDSLELSRKAAQTDAEVIVFCGVYFMAETAAILSPNKKVLIPDPNAGCPMADMINADQLRELKRQHPSAKVVCYVNSTAAVKAESDYCCTSSNAVEVVRHLQDEELIFVPDKFLGQYIASQTGKTMILWNGYCPTHMRISEKDIQQLKEKHPDAAVMVHPECTEPVKALADRILSTGGMCRFARTSDAQEFIVGTESGILHRLTVENPDKTFYPAGERAECPNMKKITLEKVLWSLEGMEHRVIVPEPIRSRAFHALNRMVNRTVSVSTMML